MVQLGEPAKPEEDDSLSHSPSVQGSSHYLDRSTTHRKRFLRPAGEQDKPVLSLAPCRRSRVHMSQLLYLHVVEVDLYRLSQVGNVCLHLYCQERVVVKGRVGVRLQGIEAT